MRRTRMFNVLLGVLMFGTLLLGALQASAEVIFEDTFGSATLAPEWLISPSTKTVAPYGGSYSLTANPGHLRYTIDAYKTSRTGGYDGYGVYYDKVLWLVRPFFGERWVLKVAATYNLRPGQPTNNRPTWFSVREPGEDGKIIACFLRGIGANDNNPNGTNTLDLYTGAPGDSPTHVIFPPSSGPIPPDSWYFEIERNIDAISIRASNDGNNSTFEYQHEYTFPAGYLVNGHQDIEFLGSGWRGSNDPPGYVDFDYIRAEVVPEPSGLIAFGTGLAGLGGLVCRRRRR